MQQYKEPIIYLDTTQPIAEKVPETSLEDVVRNSPPEFLQSIINILQEAIKVGLGLQAEQMVNMLVITPGTRKNIMANYEMFLEESFDGMIEPFYITREKLIMFLQDTNISSSKSKILLVSFDTVLSLIEASNSPTDFSDNYYYLLSELFFYAPTAITTFVIAGEIKRKLLERLNRE